MWYGNDFAQKIEVGEEMDIQNWIVAPLLSAGGLGYVNYYLLWRLGVVHIKSGDKEDKLLVMLMLSLLNYVLYWVFHYLLDTWTTESSVGLIGTIFCTLLITVGLSFFVFPSLVQWIQYTVDERRKKMDKGRHSSESVRDQTFSFKKSRIVYIFDFDHRLITAGYTGWISDSLDRDFEMTVYPFNEEPEIRTYDDVMKHIQSVDVESEVYLNFDQKIQMIILVR